MMKISRAAPFLAIALACGGKKDSPPPPDPGSGSAKPADPLDAAVAAKAPDAAAPDKEPPKKALSATCIPTDQELERVSFARIAGQLVACGADHQEQRACWNIDGKTGAVSRRDVAPLPGVGVPFLGKCFQELCAPGGEEGDTSLVAFHPDGKRAAILTGGDIAVFDVASKKVTSKFAFEISNQASALWFVGDTIFIRGDDAGPASYLNMFKLDGKQAAAPLTGIFHGGIAVSEDKLVVQEDGIDTVTVLDGRGKSTRTGPRKVPAGPCKATDMAEWQVGDGADPKEQKCFDYIKKHYLPFDAAQVILDGGKLLAFTREAVFTLDGKLAETAHVKVPMCPKPPE